MLVNSGMLSRFSTKMESPYRIRIQKIISACLLILKNIVFIVLLIAIIFNIENIYYKIIALSSESLDTIAGDLFAILKILIITLLFLVIIFIFKKIYTQKGTVVLPFEVSNICLSGVAIADQLISELIRIQQIHAVKYENLVLLLQNSYFKSKFSTEQSLGSRQLVVPKSEIAEFNMVDIGNVDVGVGSLSLGNLMIAFKSICPCSEPVTTIRGSVQKYGSTITFVAVLESRIIQSWTLSKDIESGEEEQIQKMISDIAFMIAHDVQRSDLSAKTWEGLKYYTEALGAYHQYNMSGNQDFLSLAGNYSLQAIGSEKGYKNPYDLLSLLEFTYISIGRPANSIEYCDKTIELDPDLPRAWYSKGRILQALGKYSEAVRAYDRVIELDPRYARAWNSKGGSLQAQRKLDEAMQAYDKAIEIDPKFVWPWNNKAWALRAQGRYYEAIQAHDKAIELDPNLEWLWNNKGLTLRAQGKYDEAIQAYDKAIQLNPKFVWPWNNKGWILQAQGKHDEAIQAYNKAIELDPKYVHAWNEKAWTLQIQGKYDEAIRAYNKAIELDPNYVRAWNNKGMILQAQGKYDEAIQAYEKAIELDPKLGRAWNNKGMVLKLLGQTQEAHLAFAKAKELGYND